MIKEVLRVVSSPLVIFLLSCCFVPTRVFPEYLPFLPLHSFSFIKRRLSTCKFHQPWINAPKIKDLNFVSYKSVLNLNSILKKSFNLRQTLNSFYEERNIKKRLIMAQKMKLVIPDKGTLLELKENKIMFFQS